VGVHVGLPFVMEWFVGHSGKTKPTLAGGGRTTRVKNRKRIVLYTCVEKKRK
jgi:hypothetical protein